MVMTGYTTRIVVVFSAEKFQDESLPSCLAISKKEKRKKSLAYLNQVDESESG
jgi:hypothetical protein